MMRHACLAGAALALATALTPIAAQAGYDGDPAAPLPVVRSGEEAGSSIAVATSAGAADAREEAEPEKAAPRRSASGLEKLIAAHAAENGVPVALARAVVRVESNFNAGVTGRAGEVGLMQIKPATARGIGYGGSARALYDPDTNLRWGMRYLAGAYKRASGDVCGTVMRYQGGHYATAFTSANATYCAKVKRYMAGA